MWVSVGEGEVVRFITCVVTQRQGYFLTQPSIHSMDCFDE